MHHRDPHDDPPRRGDRVPSKPVATLGQIHTAADYFNGVAFAPAEPHWVGFFRLVDDPVEYNVRNIKARSQREAHSLALILLRDRGVDVAKS